MNDTQTKAVADAKLKLEAGTITQAEYEQVVKDNASQDNSGSHSHK